MAPVFEQFALADQFATSRGSKICALSCDNAPVQVIIPTRVRAPFEPGNFDKAYNARQTLQLRCSAELEDYFKGSTHGLSTISPNTRRGYSKSP